MRLLKIAAFVGFLLTAEVGVIKLQYAVGPDNFAVWVGTLAVIFSLAAGALVITGWSKESREVGR